MNLYIYLARLNKEGIKVIASFPFGNKVHPTRVEDIVSLNLAPEMSRKVTQAVAENRMHYELYAESAETFDDLKRSLAKRGYSRLPTGQFTEYSSHGRVNEKNLVTQSKTMIRKASFRR